MDNPILSRLCGLTGGIDPVGLLTLLSVLEVERYTLAHWNEALSAVLGRRIFCPSYQSLMRYLQRTVLGVE